MERGPNMMWHAVIEAVCIHFPVHACSEPCALPLWLLGHTAAQDMAIAIMQSKCISDMLHARPETTTTHAAQTITAIMGWHAAIGKMQCTSQLADHTLEYGGLASLLCTQGAQLLQ